LAANFKKARDPEGDQSMPGDLCRGGNIEVAVPEFDPQALGRRHLIEFVGG
jgi:hypothetical protein